MYSEIGVSQCRRWAPILTSTQPGLDRMMAVRAACLDWLTVCSERRENVYFSHCFFIAPDIGLDVCFPTTFWKRQQITLKRCCSRTEVGGQCQNEISQPHQAYISALTLVLHFHSMLVTTSTANICRLLDWIGLAKGLHLTVSGHPYVLPQRVNFIFPDSSSCLPLC